jgi:hypothetical protein
VISGTVKAHRKAGKQTLEKAADGICTCASIRQQSSEIVAHYRQNYSDPRKERPLTTAYDMDTLFFIYFYLFSHLFTICNK